MLRALCKRTWCTFSQINRFVFLHQYITNSFSCLCIPYGVHRTVHFYISYLCHINCRDVTIFHGDHATPSKLSKYLSALKCSSHRTRCTGLVCVRTMALQKFYSLFVSPSFRRIQRRVHRIVPRTLLDTFQVEQIFCHIDTAVACRTVQRSVPVCAHTNI